MFFSTARPRIPPFHNEKVDTSENINDLHNIQITEEAATGDTKAAAAAAFPVTLRAIIEQGNYPLECVFNVDETAVFWNRISGRTFLPCEENPATGFKAAKDGFNNSTGW